MKGGKVMNTEIKNKRDIVVKPLTFIIGYHGTNKFLTFKHLISRYDNTQRSIFGRNGADNYMTLFEKGADYWKNLTYFFEHPDRHFNDPQKVALMSYLIDVTIKRHNNNVVILLNNETDYMLDESRAAVQQDRINHNDVQWLLHTRDEYEADEEGHKIGCHRLEQPKIFIIDIEDNMGNINAPWMYGMWNDMFTDELFWGIKKETRKTKDLDTEEYKDLVIETIY